jgi:hypothetical protein
MVDSYGDGWNGNTIDIVDLSGTIVLADLTLTHGESAELSLNSLTVG